MMFREAKLYLEFATRALKMRSIGVITRMVVILGKYSVKNSKPLHFLREKKKAVWALIGSLVPASSALSPS